MTQGILRYHARPMSFLKSERFQKEFVPYAKAYEHLTHTAGAVYEREQLKRFVEKWDLDPISPEVVRVKVPANKADELAELIRHDQIVVFPQPVVKTHPIIDTHYRLYVLYRSAAKPLVPLQQL